MEEFNKKELTAAVQEAERLVRKLEATTLEAKDLDEDAPLDLQVPPSPAPPAPGCAPSRSPAHQPPPSPLPLPPLFLSLLRLSARPPRPPASPATS